MRNAMDVVLEVTWKQSWDSRMTFQSRAATSDPKMAARFDFCDTSHRGAVNIPGSSGQGQYPGWMTTTAPRSDIYIASRMSAF